MNILPTLEGGLRIDIESEHDAVLMHAIIIDAISGQKQIFSIMGNRITDPDVMEDWQDFIAPELDEAYQTDLYQVAKYIEQTCESGTFPSSLWITREHALHWYSALNQARLALEHLHQLSQLEEPQALETSQPTLASCFYRSQFYGHLQELLLLHVLHASA